MWAYKLECITLFAFISLERKTILNKNELKIM